MDKRATCHCGTCLGQKVLSLKTVRTHMKKMETSGNEIPAKKPRSDVLHEGTSVTSFSLCMRMLEIYSKYAGVTQRCIDDILGLIMDIVGPLARADTIPKNYKCLERVVGKYLPNMDTYVSCPGEHDVYRQGTGGKGHHCETCQKDGKGSEVGRTYFYVPLIDRLRQMYKSPELARNLQVHRPQVRSPEMIGDIHQSPAWRELYSPGGLFQEDHRAIALEFSSDGFQPFHHTTSSTYSVEQQASVILNLPAELRSKAGHVLLHGLIPGPQAPKDECYNVYLRPLVDELEMLQRGVDGVWDAHRKEFFTLRATILIHVHDFPGAAKVFHSSGCGARFACPKCKSEGTYSGGMRKMVFRSGREFLAAEDPLRMDSEFPGGGEENGQPLTRNFEEETHLAAISGVLEEAVRNTEPRSASRRNVTSARATVMAQGGRKRCSEFDRLGPKEASKIAVEGMHTIQGVAKNVHALINGHKDNKGVRAHESSIGRFDGCEVDERGRLPDAPFTLTKQNISDADDLVNMISIPPQKGALPNNIFGSCHSMKSHTWHLVLTKGVYPYCLRGMLGFEQRRALFMFCHAMAIASARVVVTDLIDRVSAQLQRSMALMDKAFPETLKTILWHQIHHLPEFIARFGPIQSYWMFYFERQIHNHVSRLHSKRHAEASMMGSYRVDALCALVKSTTGNNSSNNSSNKVDQKRWKEGDNGSIVHGRDANGALYFGRVKSFFSVNIDGEGNGATYASIHWFDPATEDIESRTLSCQTTSHYRGTCMYPAVPLEKLPEPLITATHGNILYVLDFMDRRRMEELLQWMETR